MSRPGKPGMLVVGDAMLDVIAVADPPEELTLDALDYRDAAIQLQAGGTGVNLAVGAVTAGFGPVHLLCGLGCTDAGRVPDRAARIVLDELARSHVSVVANFSPDAPTGIATVAYVGGAHRIMFGSPGANEVALPGEVLERTRDVLRDVRALLVSGWTLFRPSTGPAVAGLLSEARERDVAVVLDVVPHTLHTRLPLADFRRLTRGVDYVSGNVQTFTGLYGAGYADLLLDDFTGVLVRERDGTYRVAHRSGVRRTLAAPRPAGRAAQRGSTDRFLVTAFRDHFLDEATGDSG